LVWAIAYKANEHFLTPFDIDGYIKSYKEKSNTNLASLKAQQSYS
jgi:hypothetical protein